MSAIRAKAEEEVKRRYRLTGETDQYALQAKAFRDGVDFTIRERLKEPFIQLEKCVTCGHDRTKEAL